MACMAAVVGGRAPIWAIPVQSLIDDVAPATAASGAKASLDHDSPVHSESYPRASARWAAAMRSVAGRGSAVQ